MNTADIKKERQESSSSGAARTVTHASGSPRQYAGFYTVQFANPIRSRAERSAADLKWNEAVTKAVP